MQLLKALWIAASVALLSVNAIDSPRKMVELEIADGMIPTGRPKMATIGIAPGMIPTAKAFPSRNARGMSRSPSYSGSPSHSSQSALSNQGIDSDELSAALEKLSFMQPRRPVSPFNRGAKRMQTARSPSPRLMRDPSRHFTPPRSLVPSRHATPPRDKKRVYDEIMDSNTGHSATKLPKLMPQSTPYSRDPNHPFGFNQPTRRASDNVHFL